MLGLVFALVACGRDAGASALVRDEGTGRYAVVVRGETTTSTPLVEAWDRVTLLGGDGLLACRARACAVIDLARQDAPLALPEDFAPTAGEGGCVAGTGVVCRDGSGAWNVIVPAGTFPASPERASRLAVDAVLLLFGDRLRLGSPTGVRDVTFATPTPIADVAPAARWPAWAGRAADGRLVVGSGPSGQACSLVVDHVITEPVAYGPGPRTRVAAWTRGADVVMGGERLRLPASAGTPLGLGQAPCGLSSNPFVGTASGLFGPRYACPRD